MHAVQLCGSTIEAKVDGSFVSKVEALLSYTHTNLDPQAFYPKFNKFNCARVLYTLISPQRVIYEDFGLVRKFGWSSQG